MKPIFQTKFGKPDGNCHAAALASILEIDLEEVPWFEDEGKGWYDTFVEWAVERFGLEPVSLDVDKSGDGWVWVPKGYYLINGLSPRGDYHHTVVGKDGEVVHDPHPDGAGLRTVESFTVFLLVMSKRPAAACLRMRR